MDKKNSKNAIALFAGLYVSHEMVKKDFKQSKRNAVRSGAKISKDSSKGKVYTATMQKDGKWLVFNLSGNNLLSGSCFGRTESSTFYRQVFLKCFEPTFSVLY